MKTFSKPSFIHFFQRMAPGGGGLPDFTRRGTNYLHTPLLKKYPKSKSLDSNGIFIGFTGPQNRWGPHENIFKTLIYPFFSKNGPRGGGLPDFTRRGTNYLHTPLLKKYPCHVMSCHGALEPSSAGPPSGRPSAERLAVTHTRTPMEWAPGEGGPRAPCMARRREAPGPSKVHHGQASGRSETPVPPTGPAFLGTGGSHL